MFAALISAISQLIPIFPDSRLLAPLFLGQEIPYALQFASTAGIALAGLIFFRHDWAAMVSGFLQVVLLRRRPQALDERTVFLLAISVGGAVLLAKLLHDWSVVSVWLSENPGWMLGASLLIGAGALFSADGNGKTIKTMTGWMVLDGLLCALLGGLALTFDGSLAVGILIVARFRSFYRDAASKYLSLCAITLSFVQFGRFKAGQAWGDLLPGDVTAPALQWGLSLFIAFVATWIILGSFARRTEPTAFRRVAGFRALAGLALIAWTLFGIRN